MKTQFEMDSIGNILTVEKLTYILTEGNIKLWMNEIFNTIIYRNRGTFLFSHKTSQPPLTAPYGELNHQNYSSNKNLSIQKTTTNQTTIA